MQDTSRVTTFPMIWGGVKASELATAQSFVLGLCDFLGVPKPHPTADQSYMFERPITFTHGDGSTSPGRIDCYRRGHFVLEAKKLRASAHTKTFDDGLLLARSQAEAYARALPAAEGRPPFVLVVDVGTVIEVYAEFSRSGGTYTPFPDARSHRIALVDLQRPEIRDLLLRIWTDPDSLDPAKVSAQVTRAVSEKLAEVARSLEAAGHAPHDVAAFLTRSLFSMFAEDVELLPKGSFLKLLQTHRDDPELLRDMLRLLWSDMDKGGLSGSLHTRILRFNGKLFKGADEAAFSLLLTPAQIDALIAAAQANWRDVEPAIFGTLLERALSPTERHALGAHYTPRAYVERLVLPTVIEPLRAEWADAQAAALVLAREAAELESRPPEVKAKKDFKLLDRHHAQVRALWEEARQPVRAFLHRLCTLHVLDPACGSGNFLYVTLEHLKRLEGEVLDQLQQLGERQDALDLDRETVTLRQLLGIEINERAAALAELVLWIGFLQWHLRTKGRAGVAEPVVHDYGNIEHRDAVLAYDRRLPLLDAAGHPVTRWDGVTTKAHPVTGQPVPDDSVRIPQWTYSNPRQATWPTAEFIVGNPPFIGASTMRAALGDGYVEALRASWPDVPESSDFVMYWWHHAAQLTTDGKSERFGFITTNSLRQTFNRRVVQAALEQGGLSLDFVIPDHPWVDNADGAAVRIAMSVVVPEPASAGRLVAVTSEQTDAQGEVAVTLAEQRGQIHADLRIGANISSSTQLSANDHLSNRGVQLFGSGFIVTRDEAAALGLGTVPGLERHIREYRNGKDLTARPRDVLVIDLFGLSAERVRQQYPAVYQWVYERVKPERDLNNRPSRRLNWWLFGETNPKLRQQLAGLPRYIATVETAKHRVFQFLDAAILPDNKLIAIALSDALHLGVLSSQIHGLWAIPAGSRLGVGNDPVYVKSKCFEAFPFPDTDTGLTPALIERIRHLAEQIDAHRKTQQAAQPSLTLTALYNVLEKLRNGEPLTDKEKVTHDQGLIGVLRSLHDELDAAVLAAYGWSDLRLPAQNDDLLQRLTELNARRAREEESGTIRWLRPEFQARRTVGDQTAIEIQDDERDADQGDSVLGPSSSKAPIRVPWPKTLPEQVRAVAGTLDGAGRSLTLDALAERFSGHGRWRERLPVILDTLVGLGRARQVNPSSWIDAGR